jgi:hypothetical protein
MNVTYSDKIKQPADLFALVRQATEELEKVVAPPPDLGPLVGERPSGEWDYEEDQRGRWLVVLRLSDWSGTVIGRFTREELADHDYLSGRLIRLWGDLLQIRSHKQLLKVRELIQASEGP